MDHFHKIMAMAPLTRNLSSCISKLYCSFECWQPVRPGSSAGVLSLFSALLLSVSAFPLPSILLFQIPLLLDQFFTFIMYVDRLK